MIEGKQRKLKYMKIINDLIHEHNYDKHNSRLFYIIGLYLDEESEDEINTRIQDIQKPFEVMKWKSLKRFL